MEGMTSRNHPGAAPQVEFFRSIECTRVTSLRGGRSNEKDYSELICKRSGDGASQTPKIMGSRVYSFPSLSSCSTCCPQARLHRRPLRLSKGRLWTLTAQSLSAQRSRQAGASCLRAPGHVRLARLLPAHGVTRGNLHPDGHTPWLCDEHLQN